jgi:hypothetical protein
MAQAVATRGQGIQLHRNQQQRQPRYEGVELVEPLPLDEEEDDEPQQEQWHNHDNNHTAQCWGCCSSCSWSVNEASNFLFLAASCLYVWLAIWDIRSEQDWEDEGNDDDDTVTINQPFMDTLLSPYILVSALAAFCYVLDCACHVSTLLPWCCNAANNDNKNQNNNLNDSSPSSSYLPPNEEDAVATRQT